MGKKSNSNMMPLLTAVSVGAALYSVYQNRKPQNFHEPQGVQKSQQPHEFQNRHESQAPHETRELQNVNTEDMSNMINSFLGQLK